jgi:hypothetical protein
MNAEAPASEPAPITAAAATPMTAAEAHAAAEAEGLTLVKAAPTTPRRTRRQKGSAPTRRANGSKNSSRRGWTSTAAAGWEAGRERGAAGRATGERQARENE